MFLSKIILPFGRGPARVVEPNLSLGLFPGLPVFEKSTYGGHVCGAVFPLFCNIPQVVWIKTT